MSTCCGEERKTPFCPICGTVLNSNHANIQGLLAHIRAHTKGQTATCEADEHDYPHNLTMNRRRRRALHKWQSWESAIVGLIENTDESEQQIVALKEEIDRLLLISGEESSLQPL